MSKTYDLIEKSAKEYSTDYHKVIDRKRNEHNRICHNLMRLHKEYNFPISLLLYLAVGTSAHKQKEIEKGFTKFNSQKPIQVIKLSSIIDKKLNLNQSQSFNYKSNERVVHAMSRYYDLTHDDGKELRKILSNEEVVNNLRIKIQEKRKSIEIFKLLK